jgi:hypothetical protein
MLDTQKVTAVTRAPGPRARDRRTMAAIGEPVRTHDIPDPQEVPDQLPQTEPTAVPEPAAVPG